MGRRLASGLAIGVLLLNVFGNVEAASSQTLATFSVPATAPWTSTNIVIGSGMHVTIAAEGMIHVNMGGAVQPPDGDGGSPGCVGDASFVAPGLRCWSLIGRIGNGAPFEIGRQHALAISSSDQLFLGVNDQIAGFNDNSGFWTAVVKVSRPSDTSTFV